MSADEDSTGEDPPLDASSSEGVQRDAGDDRPHAPSESAGPRDGGAGEPGATPSKPPATGTNGAPSAALPAGPASRPAEGTGAGEGVAGGGDTGGPAPSGDGQAAGSILDEPTPAAPSSTPAAPVAGAAAPVGARKAPVDSLGWRLADDGLWYPPPAADASEAGSGKPETPLPGVADLPWQAESGGNRTARWIVVAVVVLLVAGGVALLASRHSNPNAIDTAGLNAETTTTTTAPSTSTTTLVPTSSTVPVTGARMSVAELCAYLKHDARGTAKANGLNGSFTVAQFASSKLSGDTATGRQLTADHFSQGCAYAAHLPERHAALAVALLEFSSNAEATSFADYVLNVAVPAGHATNLTAVSPIPGYPDAYQRQFNRTVGSTTTAVAVTSLVQGDLALLVRVSSAKQTTTFLSFVAGLKTVHVARTLPAG